MDVLLKNKEQLSQTADLIAKSFELVQRGHITYIPAHWRTELSDPLPPPEERIWVPLSREHVLELAKLNGVLFANDGELRSFIFMLRQLAAPDNTKVDNILVRTEDGVKVLTDQGVLEPHTGSFVPNYIRPVLNTDEEDKAYVLSVIQEWVGGEEEGESLLSHLATSLSPGYSAVKYVIFLGEGRNGKSVLLLMLASLFGSENVSNVTRQMMAENSPTIAEVNDKLLNIVYDGQMAYIKDSSMEKTLIAGEPGTVRMLYESGSTKVQTNALFLEALNHEPRARDKSTALQKRLVRFRFPNVYAVDKVFQDTMTSPRMVGALLALLIDRYVKAEDMAERLAPTQTSMALQAEQAFLGSPILQFLEYAAAQDAEFLEKISKKMLVSTFRSGLDPWLMSQGIADRSDGDVLTMLKTSFVMGWKTVRKTKGGPTTSERAIIGLRPETQQALDQLKSLGEE